EFADYCGASHGVATANGTAALHAALEGLGIGAGDRVVTTPFSFVASANAVRLAGATPVFADVDPETYNLDPDAVESALQREDDVAAVLAVHLYGRPAPMDRLSELADEHDVALVEDAAQAHGAALGGRRAGSLGDVACFSFYPTKNMTTGEGGMITTDREAVAEAAARFVNHGRGDAPDGGSGYDHVDLGHNLRMTSIAAAIGLVQLERLPRFVRARRRNAGRLTEALADVPVGTPADPPDGRHAYHQYTIKHDDRDGLAAHLEDAGVSTGVYYPKPIHEQPAYAGVEASAPVAERLAERVLSLPVHPGLTERDVARVAEAVAAYEGVAAR
ncbi:MAG TPA: DegT/DnrJ/EryC1/StrS family aminotransferase, partial [Halobacteriales archaeon]|nr:DegT/DnrJ/EryC1/StrS family aminotransferase [Halobacteriales archaeon]